MLKSPRFGVFSVRLEAVTVATNNNRVGGIDGSNDRTNDRLLLVRFFQSISVRNGSTYNGATGGACCWWKLEDRPLLVVVGAIVVDVPTDRWIVTAIVTVTSIAFRLMITPPSPKTSRQNPIRIAL